MGRGGGIARSLRSPAEKAVAQGPVRDLLDELGLPSFVKTSGKTGLHICVPLVRTLDFAAVRAFATTLGKELVHRHPRRLTMEWQAKRRTGKVFVDVNQNARARAIATPYTPRAHPGAPISMPVEWARLESLDLGTYTLDDAHMFEGNDPWESMDERAVDLRKFLGME